MRILFWSDTFLPRIGGVEVLGANFVRALRARGHELLVVARQDQPEIPAREECDGVPVCRFPFRATLQARDLEGQMRLRQELTQLKQSFKPDLVHIFHSGPGVFFHHKTAAAYPAPLLFTLHQTYADELLDAQSIRGRLLRAADWVTACSHSVLGRTRRQMPEITNRSSAIVNSLEMPDLVSAPLPFAAPRLLCLGRLLRQKGFDLALSAFAGLVKDFPQARLLIAGDGEARPELEKQAAAEGVAARVDFIGWVAPRDVPALINTATLMLMPSRIEPFGLVALQAAQMARPIVATCVDGLPEVVLHGETGLLVESEDTGALAQATRRLLERPAMAARMGQAARRRAARVFDWDRHVSAYEALYQKVAVATPHTPAGEKT